MYFEKQLKVARILNIEIIVRTKTRCHYTDSYHESRVLISNEKRESILLDEF